MRTRVLVTGGAGYIGCVLVPMLLSAGYEVIVLDSLRKGGLGLLGCASNPRFRFILGDIRDETLVRESLKGADVVVHLAAIVGFPACSKDPLLARTTNVDGTVNLIRNRSSGQPIVFPSSLSNYGTVVGQVCTEEMEPKPITLYGSTKLEAERALLESRNVVVFRPATAFGVSPQMRLDLLFNEFVFQALKERSLAVYQADHVRAFIHVRDFARAMIFAVEHFNRIRDRVYNLGAEELNLTKGELARKIRERVEFRLEVSDSGEDPDKRNYRVDFSRVKGIGFQVEVGVEEGINELVRVFSLLDVPGPFTNVAHV